MAEQEKKSVTPQGQEERNIEDIDVNKIIAGESEFPQKQAFTAPEDQQGKTGQPEEDADRPEGQDDNNEKRFQYWQSQADKMKNQNDKLRSELDQLKGTVVGLSQPRQQPAEQPQEQEQDEFPPPPQPPEQPAGYSHADAVSDPSSTSAQYLQQKEEWRDNMLQYQTLKSEYLGAKQKEFVQKQEDDKKRRQEAIKRRNAVRKQVTQLEQKVRQEYGATPEQARDFIKAMSSPDAVSLENLWKLYTINSGNQQTEQAPQGQNRPSEEFLQTQKAQSVPSPMGVLPGTGGNRPDGRPVEDRVMDKIIKDEKAHNPF